YKLNDLAVALRYERLPLFDNVSGMSQATSNLLCISVTGGGYKDRRLYTNAEQSVIRLPRPVIVTGISDIVEQSDLLSRSNLLAVSKPDELLTVDEYWRRFNVAHPAILGALCSIATAGLARLAEATAPVGNRNADCLQWLAACELGAGKEVGE